MPGKSKKPPRSFPGDQNEQPSSSNMSDFYGYEEESLSNSELDLSNTKLFGEINAEKVMPDPADQRFRSLFGELYDIFDKKVEDMHKLRESIRSLVKMLMERNDHNRYPDGLISNSGAENLTDDIKRLEYLCNQLYDQNKELRQENARVSSKIWDMEETLGSILTNPSLPIQPSSNNEDIQLMHRVFVGTEEENAKLKQKIQELCVEIGMYQSKEEGYQLKIDNNADTINDLWDSICEKNLRTEKLEKRVEDQEKLIQELIETNSTLELKISMMLEQGSVTEHSRTSESDHNEPPLDADNPVQNETNNWPSTPSCTDPCKFPAKNDQSLQTKRVPSKLYDHKQESRNIPQCARFPKQQAPICNLVFNIPFPENLPNITINAEKKEPHEDNDIWNQWVNQECGTDRNPKDLKQSDITEKKSDAIPDSKYDDPIDYEHNEYFDCQEVLSDQSGKDESADEIPSLTEEKKNKGSNQIAQPTLLCSTTTNDAIPWRNEFMSKHYNAVPYNYQDRPGPSNFFSKPPVSSEIDPLKKLEEMARGPTVKDKPIADKSCNQKIDPLKKLEEMARGSDPNNYTSPSGFKFESPWTPPSTPFFWPESLSVTKSNTSQTSTAFNPISSTFLSNPMFPSAKNTLPDLGQQVEAFFSQLSIDKNEPTDSPSNIVSSIEKKSAEDEFKSTMMDAKNLIQNGEQTCDKLPYTFATLKFPAIKTNTTEELAAPPVEFMDDDDLMTATEPSDDDSSDLDSDNEVPSNQSGLSLSVDEVEVTEETLSTANESSSSQGSKSSCSSSWDQVSDYSEGEKSDF